MAEQIDQFDLGSLRAFDLVHDHAHVGENRRVFQGGLVQYDARQADLDLEFDVERKFVIDARCFGSDIDCWGFHLRERFTIVGGASAAATTRDVETLSLAPAGNRLVVGGASLAGALPTMMIAATERASQISPPGVARMREKSNPAVDAVRHTAFQIGIGLQD